MKTVIFHIDVNSAFLSWTAIRLLAEGETVDIRTIPVSYTHLDVYKRQAAAFG